MSKIHKFQLLFILLFCQLLCLGNPIAAPLPTSELSDAMKCRLPAPAFLNVVSVGSGWVNLIWTTVPNAGGYFIEIVQLSNGAIVNSTVVSSSTSSAQVSIGGGVGNCQARIRTICTNGYLSTGWTNSQVFSSIIIELVVNQLHDQAKTICTAGNTSTYGCPFSWNYFQTPFRVRVKDSDNQWYQRIFSLNVSLNSPGLGYLDLNYDNVSGDQSIELKKGYSQTRQIVEAYYKGDLICRLAVDYDPKLNEGRLFRIYAAPNVLVEKIEYLQPSPMLQNNGTGNERSDASKAILATVSPNPFKETLKIQLSETQQSTKIRLLDGLGKVQKTYSILPETTELELETADLPAGMYLLQLENGNNVHCYRVIKGQ